MCARYYLTASKDHLQSILQVDLVGDLLPRYNIAPTQSSLVVFKEWGHRTSTNMRWGLVPSWAKDIAVGQKMINARSETVIDKASFRDSVRKRRCVIPASGFFEWRDGKALKPTRTRKFEAPSLFEELEIDAKEISPEFITVKQPYAYARVDGEPLVFAGIWDQWMSGTGQAIQSFTILTTEPNDHLREVHDRMPCILEFDEISDWIDETEDGKPRLDLLDPFPPSKMHEWPVSTDLNLARNEWPELIQPITLPPL
jgi:putative SOS response-associated peptidase YedK